MNREIRREKVKRLMAKGYSQREMAKELGVSLPTINSDVAVVTDELIEHFKKENTLEILLADVFNGLKEVQREAYRLYEETSNGYVKVACLKRVLDAIEGQAIILQRIGALPWMRAKVEVRHEFDDPPTEIEIEPELHEVIKSYIRAVGDMGQDYDEDSELVKAIKRHLRNKRKEGEVDG